MHITTKKRNIYLTILLCFVGLSYTSIHVSAYREKDVYTAYYNLIKSASNDAVKYNKTHEYDNQSSYYSVVNIDSSSAPELVITIKNSMNYWEGATQVYSYKNGKAYLVCQDNEVTHKIYKGENCIYSVQSSDTMEIPMMYDRISLQKGLQESYISYDRNYFTYDNKSNLAPISTSEIKSYEKSLGGPSSGNKLYGKVANYKDVCKAVNKLTTEVEMYGVDSTNNLKKSFGMTVELGNTTNNYLSRDGGPFSCSDGTYMFFAGQDGIYKTNIKTHRVEKIVSVSESNGIYCLSTIGDYIYYVWDKANGSDQFDAYIYRIKKDGTNKKELVKGFGTYIVGDIMYYNDYSNNQECYLNLNTLKCEALVEGNDICTVSTSSLYHNNNYVNLNSYKITEIKSTYYQAIYNNYFYYVGYINNGGYYIYKQTSDGKNKSKVIDKMSAQAFSIFNGYLYYINDSNLCKFNLKTQKTSVVSQIENNISTLTVYKKVICYSVWDEDSLRIDIYIMNIDGTSKKKIAERYTS